MHRLTSVEELEKVREKTLEEKSTIKTCITICLGTGCHAYDSQAVYETIKKEIASHGLTEEVELKPTGCHGFCEQGPIIVIYPGEICYCRVKPENVKDIIEMTVLENKIVEDLLYEDPVTGEKFSKESDIPFYKNQNRIVFGKNRFINPQDIRDYFAEGGYRSLAKVLTKMTPEQVIDEIKRANLRGRGGGGFPAGVKWEITRNAPEKKKYVIVNADEGDPGAYMDRSLLEGNPHLILEGLTIGAYAIGANKGYVYCRAEYPIAVKRLNLAISQAKEQGLLGKNIFGTDFEFDLEVRLGAGAFVCGEETALLASIEGERGEPRLRPPYPVGQTHNYQQCGDLCQYSSHY